MKEFLTQYAAVLNFAGIERKLDIPPKTLYKFIKGERKLTPVQLNKLKELFTNVHTDIFVKAL